MPPVDTNQILPMTSSSREWQNIQHTTFVNWVNDKLSSGKNPTGRKVERLNTDLSDGVLLIRLLENLTGVKFPKYNAAPKLAAHSLVNLDIAFQYLREEGVKLVSIGSQNVFNGDLTLIMGLVWTLIQKYQIKIKGTQGSAKQVMLEWLQAFLPSCWVTNFTRDWSNGIFLLALINEIKAGLVPTMDRLNPSNKDSNCTLAIRTASTHLKIPPILIPEDLSSNSIDELSIITYLSYFCKPAEAMLLKWVRDTAPYTRVSNFSSDWSNGLTLAAIVEACFPGTFPDWRQLRPEEGAENVARIFAAVKTRLGVVPNMTAEELASGKVEDLKVMAYILRIRNGRLQTQSGGVSASGPGLSSATVGKQTHFTINTAMAGPGQLHIDAQDSKGTKVTFSLTELRNSIMVRYTPQYIGELIFDILWSNQPIANSPFIVKVLDSDSIRIIDLESHPTFIHTNQPIQLDIDTSRSGHGFVTAFFSYSDSKRNVFVKSTSDGGKVSLAYTPVTPGEAMLRLFWNNEELSHLAIHYTVVDHSSYKVVSYPEKRLYCTFDSAQFCIKSIGAPLNHLQMTAICGDVQIPIGFRMIDGKVGYASFVPTLSGKFRVEVVCAGQLVEGSPFLVQVSDPSKCVVKTHFPKYMSIGEAHEFTVSTKDAGEGEIEFVCHDGRKVEENFCTTLVQDPDGTQHLFVTPLNEGEFSVGLTFCNTFIGGSPFTLLTCNPTRCMMISRYENAIVGLPVEFVITVPSPLLKPVVKATGKTAHYNVTVTTADDISYKANFLPWEVGRHEVAITYGSYHIPGSPVVFNVNPQSGGAYTATGAGLQSALTGVPSKFYILTRVPGLLENGNLSVSVRGVINKVEGRVRMRDNADGTYSVAYLIYENGAYLISVQVGGQHIIGSPFRLTATLGPQANKCRIHGSALDDEAILTVGRPIEFSVDTTGAGSGKLTVKAIGPQGKEAKVFLAKNQKSAVYDIKLDPLTSGKHRVSVKWTDVHVPGSPFLLKIWPGIDPSKCRAYGPGLQDGVVGRLSQFTIETRHAGAGVLVVHLRGVKNAFKISMKPADETDRRTLIAQYEPQAPGDYLISILWSDQHIPGSPFKVRIEDQVQDAERFPDKKRAGGGLATPLHSQVDLSAHVEDDEGEQEDPRRKSRLTRMFSKSEKSKPANSTMPNFSRSSMRSNSVTSTSMTSRPTSTTAQQIASSQRMLVVSHRDSEGTDTGVSSPHNRKEQSNNKQVFKGQATVVQIKPTKSQTTPKKKPRKM